MYMSIKRTRCIQFYAPTKVRRKSSGCFPPLSTSKASTMTQVIFARSRNCHCLWPCSLAVPVLAGWVYGFCGSYVQELPKAQPAVVLVLKRLRRRGNGLKSHPTDWEKPGIEPNCLFFVAVFLGCTSTGRVGLCFCGSKSRNSRRLNWQWFWF